MERSSNHLKEALKVKVGNDKEGNPVLIPQKRLRLLGVWFRGDRGWRLKGEDSHKAVLSNEAQ